jgi:hypothetical protein
MFATASSLSLDLNRLRLDQLQEAIRANQVTFPSQVPVFIKHSAGKQQCHIVLLYFVLGWSCDRIAKRYEVTRQHIWQIVSEWRRHAVALGYLQVIPPLEALTPLRTPLPALRLPDPRPIFQPVHAAVEVEAEAAALAFA